mmetsp:Transcript_6470/g.19514  ORF Transcript_6470/g.19514 Transcript_6470/m.19514 type:complete len:261 (+) Transcript_6470:515-1297(+)
MRLGRKVRPLSGRRRVPSRRADRKFCGNVGAQRRCVHVHGVPVRRSRGKVGLRHPLRCGIPPAADHRLLRVRPDQLCLGRVYDVQVEGPVLECPRPGVVLGERWVLGRPDRLGHLPGEKAEDCVQPKQCAAAEAAPLYYNPGLLELHVQAGLRAGYVRQRLAQDPEPRADRNPRVPQRILRRSGRFKLLQVRRPGSAAVGIPRQGLPRAQRVVPAQREDRLREARGLDPKKLECGLLFPLPVPVPAIAEGVCLVHGRALL